MARSLYKGPFLDQSVLKLSSNETKKIWSRRSTILPQFVEKTFEIYTGNRFIRFKVTEEAVGHKFGEFALTRKKPKHPTAKGKGATQKSK